MIVSSQVVYRVVSGLCTATALCALSFVTLGVANAQDSSRAKTKDIPKAESQVDPAIQTLRDKIKSEELSVDEARLIYNEMNRESVTLRISRYKQKIDAAVAAGKMTTEEAAEKLDATAATVQSVAFYTEVFEMSAEDARAKMAIASGTMTEEQSKSKLGGEPTKVTRENIRGIIGEMRAALAEGKMTQEQYDAKLKSLIEKLRGSRPASSVESSKTGESQLSPEATKKVGALRKMLGEGKMTREEYALKVAEIKKADGK